MAVNGAVEVAIAGKRSDISFHALEHEVAVHYVRHSCLPGDSMMAGGLIALMKGRQARSGKHRLRAAHTHVRAANNSPSLATQLEKAGQLPSTAI